MVPFGCSCCLRQVGDLAGTLHIGDLSFCRDCRPADPDEYHEALITGPWPPAILAGGWTCPHSLTC
jgi:hypothetical protein